LAKESPFVEANANFQLFSLVNAAEEFQRLEKNKQKKTAITELTAIIIVDAKTIIVTLIIVSWGFYRSLR
jgi:hypothetical protein